MHAAFTIVRTVCTDFVNSRTREQLGAMHAMDIGYHACHVHEIIVLLDD
jgi:hypothetical protein